MSRRLAASTLLTALLVIGYSGSAQAAFHAWDVAEVFSNADGSIQYIEFTTASNGQHQVGNWRSSSPRSRDVLRAVCSRADAPKVRSDR